MKNLRMKFQNGVAFIGFLSKSSAEVVDTLIHVIFDIFEAYDSTLAGVESILYSKAKVLFNASTGRPTIEV